MNYTYYDIHVLNLKHVPRSPVSIKLLCRENGINVLLLVCTDIWLGWIFGVSIHACPAMPYVFICQYLLKLVFIKKSDKLTKIM